MEIPMDTTVKVTGKSSSTVTDWFNMCREVCSIIVSCSFRGQMKGTHEMPVQIDEARFAGRRKYNRGRLLAGDHGPLSEDSEAEVDKKKNHGARIDGPWVFGLKQGADCRYFYVQRWEKDTLVPIIQSECQKGSVIHSGEWRAYSNLNAIGFIHKTVNHQRNYVDPGSGAHTSRDRKIMVRCQNQYTQEKKKKRSSHSNVTVTPWPFLLEGLAKWIWWFISVIFTWYNTCI